MPTPKDLIVIGGGEHARAVIDAAQSRPDLWRVVGFLDEHPCSETAERFGLPRLGNDRIDLRAQYAEAFFVLGVGSIDNPKIREEIVRKFEEAGVKWAVLVHRDATVSPTSRLEEGAVVFARAVVNTGSRVGRHCVINTSAVVEHDVVVGDFSQLAPAAVVGGGARIGCACYLGLGSRVRDHVVLGDEVFVAMGAVVVSNVANHVELRGVPARAWDGKK